MMESFDARDHYWVVAGDDRVWSSAAGGYVSSGDASYKAWLAAGGAPTRIANEFELDQVLRQHGLSTGMTFTAEEALDALARIDAGRVKAALGRENVRPEALGNGDADTLRALAAELQPRPNDGQEVAPPAIAGATRAVTTEERLGLLERKAAGGGP